MDLNYLNSHLRPYRMEFVCQNCGTAKRPKTVSPPLQTLGKKKTAKSKVYKIRKPKRRSQAPSTPVKNGKASPVKATHLTARTRVNDQFETQVKPQNYGSKLDFTISPVSRNCPPNHHLNLNSHFPTYRYARTPVKATFEETMATPFKIADIHFPSNHKNSNVLDTGFRPQIFSTADAKPRAAEGDSIRDFSFDSNERKNYLNLVAFQNVPSCFQSPFLLGKPQGAAATPYKSVCFDRIPENLDFLENPFFEDFE
jgi:hypothetical protein